MCRDIHLSISTILYKLKAARNINPQLTTTEWEIIARELTGPQLAVELLIFSSALQMQKVIGHTMPSFNSLAHLNVQLLLDKMNLQEVRSHLETVSYYFYLAQK